MLDGQPSPHSSPEVPGPDATGGSLVESFTPILNVQPIVLPEGPISPEIPSLPPLQNDLSGPDSPFRIFGDNIGLHGLLGTDSIDLHSSQADQSERAASTTDSSPSIDLHSSPAYQSERAATANGSDIDLQSSPADENERATRANGSLVDSQSEQSDEIERDSNGNASVEFIDFQSSQASERGASPASSGPIDRSYITWDITLKVFDLYGSRASPEVLQQLDRALFVDRAECLRICNVILDEAILEPLATVKCYQAVDTNNVAANSIPGAIARGAHLSRVLLERDIAPYVYRILHIARRSSTSTNVHERILIESLSAWARVAHGCHLDASHDSISVYSAIASLLSASSIPGFGSSVIITTDVARWRTFMQDRQNEEGLPKVYILDMRELPEEYSDDLFAAIVDMADWEQHLSTLTNWIRHCHPQFVCAISNLTISETPTSPQSNMALLELLEPNFKDIGVNKVDMESVMDRCLAAHHLALFELSQKWDR